MIRLRRKLRMSVLCLKTRTCLLLFTCVVGCACITFLWLVDEDVSRRPKSSSWNILFSQTQRHLRGLQDSNGDDSAEADSYLRALSLDPIEYSRKAISYQNEGSDGDDDERRETYRHSDGGRGEVNATVARLRQSFTAKCASAASSITPLVVIVVGVHHGQVSTAWELYKSVLVHAPELPVYFYDLGLAHYEKQDITNRCKNASATISRSSTAAESSCQIRSIDTSWLPAHLLAQGSSTDSPYRPFIIQDAMLNVTGSGNGNGGGVLYLSANCRFRDRPQRSVFEKACRLGGVTGWRSNNGDSTSAITHPKTFRSFGVDTQNYYFHHTVTGDTLIVYNTEFVRRHLMYPWLRCALTRSCVSPIGAQRTGCQRQRKPLYLYSGCHQYDVSVMNVVLGLMFSFDSAPYTIDRNEGRFIYCSQHHNDL